MFQQSHQHRLRALLQRLASGFYKSTWGTEFQTHRSQNATARVIFHPHKLHEKQGSYREDPELMAQFSHERLKSGVWASVSDSFWECDICSDQPITWNTQSNSFSSAQFTLLQEIVTKYFMILNVYKVGEKKHCSCRKSWRRQQKENIWLYKSSESFLVLKELKKRTSLAILQALYIFLSFYSYLHI